MIDYIAQMGIVVFGCSAVFLISLKNQQYRRWGYVAGLVSEPCWLYTAISHEQWGIIVLALWYTYAWANGVKNHFFS